MKRNGTLVTAFAVASLAALFTPAMASADVIAVHLVGYNETPVTINSAGSASFVAKISEDGTSIEYELSYGGLSSTVLQSHIHFGEPAITGPVVLFLCTNLGNAPATVPVPQACPAQPATITGTLTAANVIANTAGIDGGAAGFAEMVKAIRSGAAYVNVHTMVHPSGEVRARLSGGGD
jgi:CHRD domain